MPEDPNQVTRDLLKSLGGGTIEAGSMLNAGVQEVNPSLANTVIRLVSEFKGRPAKSGSTVTDPTTNEVVDQSVSVNDIPDEEISVRALTRRIMHELSHGMTEKEEFIGSNAAKTFAGEGLEFENAELDDEETTAFLHEGGMTDGVNSPKTDQLREAAFGGEGSIDALERRLFDAIMTMMVEKKNAR